MQILNQCRKFFLGDACSACKNWIVLVGVIFVPIQALLILRAVLEDV
tara:strand:- start:216 stop:356 length:141 start_codon:yes stop_codon:yes gene_type:complete